MNQHQQKIRDLIDIQKNLHGKDGYKGCQDDPLKEYHRGMANGLIIAEKIVSDDVNDEVELVGN